MPTFRIIETRPATATWEFIVEAATETEALNKVIDGDIEPDEHYTDIDWDEDGEYKIYDAIVF